MKIYIDKLENGDWVKYNDCKAKDWESAVQEVVKLNEKLGKKEYRAVCVNGFLTHIYCSGFYTVPTCRSY